LGIEVAVAAAGRKVLSSTPWITRGGGSETDGSYFRVSDDITRWDGLETRTQLVESLKVIADHQRREYADMASAKAEMVFAAQRGVGAVQVPVAAPHWYDSPVAKGLAWTLATILTAVGEDVTCLAPTPATREAFGID
jgi:hypothetical protein